MDRQGVFQGHKFNNKLDIRRLAQGLVPDRRAGDFAQALMDLGATICLPRAPACMLCPWRLACAAYSRGDPERFPRKAKKQQGRLRRGAAYVVTRADGAVLVRTRLPKGLLGGMTEVPISEWTPDFDLTTALDAAPRRFGIMANDFSVGGDFNGLPRLQRLVEPREAMDDIAYGRFLHVEQNVQHFCR